MRGAYPSSVILALLLVLGLTQTGCVTSKKYKLAKENTPPARSLDWTAVAPPAELTLQTLIVIKGPGSWKREAHWDEYVVKLTNHGAAPLRIRSVELIDVLGQPQVPGTEPWALEKLSYSNWDKYGGAGLSLLAGAGVVAIMGGIAYGAAMGSLMSGMGGVASTAGAGAGASAALVLIPVVAVVDITAVAMINHKNKGLVQAEFDRRRLVLPLTVEAGASVSGSFFFPMTPGPQRMILQGQAGAAPMELVLDLKRLAGLHLKPAETKTTP